MLASAKLSAVDQTQLGHYHIFYGLHAKDWSKGADSDHTSPSTSHTKPRIPRVLSADLDAEEAYIITHMLPAIQVADKPRAIRRNVFAASRAPVPRTYLWAAILLPEFDNLDQKTDTLEANMQITLAAASVLSSRAQNGVYPDILPSSFIDPFTGKSLGYRREANGFVVSSVGETGKFDGGKSGQKPQYKELLYRYPAPHPTPIPEYELVRPKFRHPEP